MHITLTVFRNTHFTQDVYSNKGVLSLALFYVSKTVFNILFAIHHQMKYLIHTSQVLTGKVWNKHFETALP